MVRELGVIPDGPPVPMPLRRATGNVNVPWTQPSSITSCLGLNLSDRTFHLKLDQALELDAVFHREVADEIVHEPVDAQAHGLRFAQAALLHVENLLGAHLADTCFVLHGIAGAAHGDSRVSIRAAGRVRSEEQTSELQSLTKT